MTFSSEQEGGGRGLLPPVYSTPSVARATTTIALGPSFVCRDHWTDCQAMEVVIRVEGRLDRSARLDLKSKITAECVLQANQGFRGNGEGAFEH